MCMERSGGMIKINGGLIPNSWYRHEHCIMVTALLLVALLPSISCAGATIGGRTVTQPNTAQGAILAEKLELGFRALQIDLKNQRKGEPFNNSFIGSIDTLEAEQQQINPYRFFIQYALLPWAGFGLQGDHLQIQTLTSLPREIRSSDRDTDGNAEMKALMPYLFVRFPNSSPATPYAELGYALYRNDFNPHPAWYENGKRRFLLKDSSTAFLAVGVDFKLQCHFEAGLYFRSIDMDVDGSYVFLGDSRPPEAFTFEMSHYAYGASLKYVF